MSTNLDQGGLKLVNIHITSQRIVWLSKLCSMEQARFTRVVAEEQIGHFETGYHDLDFLKINPDCFPIHSNNKFYEEVIKASNKVNIEYILMEEEHIYGNPRIGFHSRNLSDGELVCDILASTKSDWLRNFITFTVRFVVHRSPGTNSRNPEIVEAKITNMAKQKISQEIYNQYLFGDILGTMRNNVQKVSNILEA